MLIFFGVICTPASVWAAEPLTDEEKIAAIMPIIFGLLESSPPTPVNGSITVAISNGNDDVEENTATGVLDKTSTDLELVYDGKQQAVGLRFQNAKIPQGATIKNAYIQFRTDEVSSSAVSLTIKGDNADNSAVFNGAYNVSSTTTRPVTTASVVWTPAAWTVVDEVSEAQRTPDLSTIVQEIVNRGGWAVNNAMSFIITGDGSTNKRVADSFEDGWAPKLVVEFEYINKAPVIASIPTTVIPKKSAINTQVLTVSASDPDGDNLTYSIDGSVPFAIDATGKITLNAVPQQETHTFNVKVSDGKATTTVPVTVLTLLNLALAPNPAAPESGGFGVATQSSTYDSSSAASNAIDGNLATTNHTNCLANDWWQVKLPDPTLVSRIIVTGRESWASRLAGAEVYVSANSATNGGMNAGDKVFTLAGTANAQNIPLAVPKSATYVIVKAAPKVGGGTECLHMREVEVYGQGAPTPAFSQTSYQFNLYEKALSGTAVGTVKADDYQKDTVTYRLVGNVPFAIDAQGQITLNGTLNHNLIQSYSFSVEASDGSNVATVPVTVKLGKGNGVWLQRWEGISGTSVDSLLQAAHYKNDAPDYAGSAAALDVKTVSKDNYGQKLTAFLVPAVSGNYQFAIVGDDATQLKLSPNINASQASKIAENGYGAYQDWNAAGKSTLIALEAGKPYYIEALHKEGTGGDYVSVGWKREGDASFTLIPAGQLYQDAMSVGVVIPAFAAGQRNYLIPWNTASGSIVASALAADPQGDSLTYSIVGTVPFVVDAAGNVKVNGSLTPSASYTFEVMASDGINSVSTTLTIRTTSDTAVQDALVSGNADAVTTTELLGVMAGKLTDAQSRCEATLNTLYPNGFKLKPDVDIGMLQALTDTMPGWIPWIVAKNAGSPKIYAYVKELPNGTRVVASGIPLFSPSQMKANFNDGADKAEILNLLKWLAGSKGKDSSGQLKSDADFLNTTLKITYHGGGAAWGYGDWYGLFKLPQWTGDNFNPTAGVTFAASGLPANWTNTSTNNPWDAVDLTKLADASQDIFMLGEATDVAIDTILAHAASGSPKGIYVQYSPPTYSTKVNSRLGIKKSGAWYGDDQLAYGDMPSIAAQCQVGGTPALVALVNNLEAGMPNFNYEATDCPNDIGTVKCDLSKVTDAAGNSVASLFNDGASAIRSRLLEWDYTGTDVFSLSAEYDFFKLAVLLGDKYRATTHYPMDKVTTDDTTFYQALFSDFAVHYARSGNHYQPDMGDFTDAQVALNVATTKTATRTYTPTVFGEWTSTGLYAPPGKVITVRRTDTGNSVVKLSFNFLRESTRLWNENKYSRPRYMSSPVVTIEKGKTYTFSTPYGGPIYLGWTGVETGATPFTVEITNVLDNPLLQAFDDTSIQTFLTALEQTDSDWVDIKTPFAEIHSLKSYVLQSFASQDGDAANGYTTADVKTYIDDLNKYLIAGNYEYAGFTGGGLNGLNAEVSTFCNTLGLASQCTDVVINAKPAIQHVNADVNAACGGLCAGNPFDSGYPIDPLGWGENHEMGHNLQRARLKIYGGISSEVSNNIFPLHTQWRWTVAKGLGKHPDQDRPSNQEAFTILQNAIKVGTPANSSHPLWAGTGTYDNAFERLAFYIQLLYTQQFPGMPPSEATEKAWGLYTKLYLMERIFTDAIKTDAKWAAVKDQLGFGSYTRTEAAAINTGNDFMYVATSKIAGRNYSDYFAAWGIEVSDKAKAQVTANGGVGQVPLLFYYVNDELPAVMPTDADTIPLNGTSTWVDPTP